MRLSVALLAAGTLLVIGGIGLVAATLWGLLVGIGIGATLLGGLLIGGALFLVPVGDTTAEPATPRIDGFIP